MLYLIVFLLLIVIAQLFILIFRREKDVERVVKNIERKFGISDAKVIEYKPPKTKEEEAEEEIFKDLYV